MIKVLDVHCPINNSKAVFNFDAIPSLDAAKTYAVRDLWERKDLGDATEKLTTRVRPHATKVFRLAEKKLTPLL